MIAAALLVSVPLSLQGNYGSLIFGIPQFVIGMLYIILSRVENRIGRWSVPETRFSFKG